ncbi:DNA binding protein [Arthrobacter phage Qui]|uniref:RNA polymerase sigma factor n=1 Tax=Arthrobacter phage Qui TaxID=2603260 RepID=A0A5B8WPH0_9CAUD|nr:DNA binding protein [Arthrobacter phage Qui]QED11578.1 DNA binding protein [Arthrobacter phage Qui]QOC56410.1 DNA binding protein [Arthrobacter phage Paella]
MSISEERRNTREYKASNKEKLLQETHSLKAKGRSNVQISKTLEISESAVRRLLSADKPEKDTNEE